MFQQRAVWLNSWWFLAAVALLLFNDHVSKQMWPGLVTGKLSDFAGLVVVATVASIVFGRTWGITFAGSGFVALKTVVGVAEMAAPLLGGGVTLRDPTDLVALLALPGLWLILGRTAAKRSARSKHRWQLVGLTAAVLATTATSAAPDQIRQVGFVDGAFYAEIYLASDSSGTTRWLSSTDGGSTWQKAQPRGVMPKPTDVHYGPPFRDPTLQHSMSYGTQQCANDGVCYQSLEVSTPVPDNNELTYRIDRRAPGADWSKEADTEASGNIAVNPSDSNQAVVAASWTAYYRSPSGTWEEVNLIKIAR